MRPYTGYYEDLDEIEACAYGRSRAYRRLLENHRRDERHQDQRRDFRKKRYQREPWDWDDDDD